MYNLARISKVLQFYSIVHSCRNIDETCLAKIIEMPGIHSKRHANSKHAIYKMLYLKNEKTNRILINCLNELQNGH